jgi:hypothetical protein
MVVTLLVLGSSANATQSWNVADGVWSVASNWSGGLLPTTTETAQINNGTCTLDASQTIGQLLMGGVTAGNVGVLNINTGANLNIAKNSQELFGLQKLSGTTATVNHSSGTVRVFRPDGAMNGETRLVTGSAITSGSSTYNLSGTAVLDTEVLSKGLKTANATFNATGGTLVIRNMIFRFGLISEGYGFNQGLATLEIGQINAIGAMAVGNATNTTDYTAGTGATLDFDFYDDATFDKVTQMGAVANLAGATMNIDLLGGYAPAVGSFFDVWKITDAAGVANGNGSGSVLGLPTGWAAAWVDTNADTSTDTLRLTFTPEPATIALLGLGALALRRGKK